ncbi:hypothetical protein EBA01_19140 [Xanthomonas oryzae pv. oryzae]|nr:hypothetical protein C0L89_19150 [Xanthomonas oryzae pv. oryzae]AVU04118.1 hypothetical protein C0L90_19475 [Xanthomonas oryzae pv. oryzae]QBI13692.1 hypothetical protein EYR02_19390 [Xanthomonas oryzae pv. oryzae]QBI17323.1 hypothetical protein EYR03_19740 [Xanthomonas oryzae pv. oryzae]QBN23777.1 hypothetical protein EBA00_03155 [Xanthomonas oryzae pv. oryzae]
MPPHSEQIVSRICGALFRGSLMQTRECIQALGDKCCMAVCRALRDHRRLRLSSALRTIVPP